MVMGRPKTWDREDICRQLLEWASLPSSLNLNAFCVSCEPPIPPSQLIRLSKENDDFCQSYELAKSWIAARREEANSEKMLSDAAYNKNARNYDYFLKHDWKEEEIFKSSLKKEENDVGSSQAAKIISDAIKLTSGIKQ